MSSNYSVKTQGPVVVIDLPDRDFADLAEALTPLGVLFEGEKILCMNSLEPTDTTPFRIVIVFDIFNKKE